MHLKRLELHGFKSFAPRTVLEFNTGVTGIVGPNGSGKSNIADGIRWVLGEQSMRQLRGKKSDDVIFVGGQGRAAAQMAEVGLVLDNSASWLPSEFTEVSVARRSFRNGDSEYLINGQRVRLKDVLMLLAQARIGHDSYTVIGQGMVDQALSVRAEERRALFEDAAGIRQFQAQRNEAEQKLNLTQSNLARLRDILGEIEPRLGPLAEQARRAREFSGAREDLASLLRLWYRRQWQEAHTAAARADQAERDHAARIQQAREALATRETQTQAIRQRREDLLGEIGQLRRERSEVSGRLQTTERDLAVARERLASLDRQQDDLQAEQTQQEDAIAVAETHLETLEDQLAEADERVAEKAVALEALEQAQHTARLEQEREEARLRNAQREVIQMQARLGAAQTELGRLQRQLGERNRTLASRREVAAQAQRKLEEAERQLADRRQTFDTAKAAVEALVAQRERLTHEIGEGQAEHERLRAATADAERERRALSDRLSLLEEWRRNLEGFGEGVRALLQAPDETRPPLLGTIAQLITAAPGLEAAIEAAFGPFLQAILVSSPADARQAAQWLRERGAGHATFFWPREQPTTPTPTTPTMPAPDGQALLGFARDLVQAPPEARTTIARILGNAYIVRDAAVIARHWPDAVPPVPLITLAGDVLHPKGWLRGGAFAATSGHERDSSFLARERELRQLPAQIERTDATIAELRAQFERASVLQGERKAHDEALRKEIQRAEAQAQEIARAVTTLQREHERAASELHLSDAVAEQLAAEVQGIEREVTATTERVAEHERAQQETSERIEDIQLEMDDLLERNRAQQDELTRGRTAIAVQRQEIKALTQRIEAVRGQIRELQLQLGRRDERLQALTRQRDELTTLTDTQASAIGELRARTHNLGETLRDRDDQQATLDRHIAELERGQQAEREQLARLEVEHQRCVAEAERAREAIEALITRIREELASESADADGDPLQAFAGGEANPEEDERAASLTADDLARMRRQIDQLRARLKHLGGYDPEAPQAYEELKTRYDFLTSQVRDMEQASANLRNIITELDTTMRRQFEETFHAVNQRFQRHFVTLFNGGAARLELLAPRRAPADDEDEESAGEPGVPRKVGLGGVEVFVQIPGKKIQDLALLSGGERAMVSAALLFALLETNPPPFCLLDEVDAALDEANVVRFCQILKVLAEQTQFIIITHNRVTMTHTDAIYGITMGVDSISKVLSMSLAEAEAVRGTARPAQRATSAVPARE